MSERGLSTLEVLVASALLLAIAAALGTLAGPLRDAFDRTIGSSELTSGSRLVLEQLAAEIREAGSGASVAATGTRLAAVIPTIVPLATLDDGSAGSPSRALRLIRVPRQAPQGVLLTSAPAGTTLLQLNVAGACSRIGPACGFQIGMPAVLHDETRAAVVTIQSAGEDGVVLVTPPLPAAFEGGAVLAAISVTAYGLRSEADGSFRLVKATPGTEQPMLQHVVDFQVLCFGPDPLRVSDVQLVLRVESASAALRGPAGRLFRRAGTSTRPSRWIPDVEMRMSVATRNVAGA